MDFLTRKELRELIEKRGKLCASVYMPTYQQGAKSQANQIAFKTRLKHLKELLEAEELDPEEIEEFLEPAWSLAEDSYFWGHQSTGFAAFISRDEFRRYRLPIKTGELSMVAERYHIKPLLPMFSADEKFYVLALSQNEIRLLEGTHYTVNQVHIPEVPGSIDEALWHDDPERSLQWHTGAASASGRDAVFHGHGVGADEKKDKKNLLRYFQRVDRGLHDILKEEQSPLILAGVGYLYPIYQEANSYPYLTDEGIEGNPEEMDPRELHHKAWGILEPRLAEEQKKAIKTYQELAARGKTIEDIKQAVPAAHYARIGLMFVARGQHIWGKFDSEQNQIELFARKRPGSEDLSDRAAVETILHGGKVYVLDPDDMPSPTGIAAALRF